MIDQQPHLDPLSPEGFAAIQRERLEKDIAIYPARSWYPSSVGDPCDRKLVWRFNRWEEEAKHSFVMESIFHEGRLHQPDVVRRLEKMGYEVIPESDRPVQWKVGKDKRAVISGRPDGRLRSFRDIRFAQPVVMEIKSLQGHTWERLSTIEDVRNAPEPWVRAYGDQGNLYCLLEELPSGVLVLKNKATGLLKLIPFALDLERAEKMVARIERLQEWVDAEKDPDPIEYDERICGRCGFRNVCFPPRSMGPGLQVLEDLALLEDIERWDDLKQDKSEYDGLDKAIKKRLKALGTFEAAAVGPWIIYRKEVPVKAYKVDARVDVRFEVKNVLKTQTKLIDG